MTKKIVILIFLLLLFYRENIPEDHARVLLAPYARVVELFYNNSHVYVSGTGFVETGGSYIIGSDCMGLGFTALLFVTSAVYPLKILAGAKKLLWVMFSAAFSILTGFIVNLSRILNSLTFLSHEKFYTLHALFGSILYLFVFCGVYFLLVKAFGAKLGRRGIM